MYNPSHFAESRSEVLGALIAAHPLATLVTLSQGQLVANCIPLLLRYDETPFGMLIGHVARAQPRAVDDAPRTYTDTMIQALIGISIPAVTITGKWKVRESEGK